MRSYIWTEKGKAYFCYACGETNPFVLALLVNGVEMQFCRDCWPGFRNEGDRRILEGTAKGGEKEW